MELLINADGEAVEPGEMTFETAVCELGFIHIWKLNRDVVVWLWPSLVNPITMTGAMDEIARLDQDWTIVCSMAPGGKTAWFPGYMGAIRMIAELMEEAGRIEPYPDYEKLRAEAARFAESELLSAC
jgi:hypothetical protein